MILDEFAKDHGLPTIATGDEQLITTFPMPLAAASPDVSHMLREIFEASEREIHATDEDLHSVDDEK